MALITTKRTSFSKTNLRYNDASSPVGFLESQKLARQKGYGKRAKHYKLKLEALAVFTQQLSSMLEAGLPIVSALEALQDQTEPPYSL